MKTEIISISLPIVWENKEQNLLICSEILEQIFKNKNLASSNYSQLVIFPEMFTTGFTMNINMAEEANSDSITIKWIENSAEKFNCAILGSVAVKEDNKFFNRAYFMLPDKTFFTYDKRHLFRMGEEGKLYTAGNKKTIFNYNGVNYSLNLCYDLRFPVWSRNKNNEYDVLLNCANFPAARFSVIEPLCKARAIENLSYMIFTNRSGSDPLAGEYCASSYIVDFKGNNIGHESFINIKLLAKPVRILSSVIDIEALRSFREKFPAWLDND